MLHIGAVRTRTLPTPSPSKQKSSRTSQVRCKKVVASGISDADMAWLLADAAGGNLIGHERTLLFVELGSGEHLLAIERVLDVVMCCRPMLSPEVFGMLTTWLDGRVGSLEEARLRGKVAVILAHQILRKMQADVPSQSRHQGYRRAGAPASVHR